MTKVRGKTAPSPAPTGRIGVLVLGMHRSGTSALTRVLSLLGCDLPKTMMVGGQDNEMGHWESNVVCSVNEALLDSAGSNWHDWLPFNSGWYSSPKAGEFKERALATLRDEFGESRLFVLKDPRICRFAPFWLDVLEAAGVRPAIITPVRNPLEVAASLERRDGFNPALGHLLWLRHVLEAEKATRGHVRLYSSYDGLLAAWPSLAKRAQSAWNFDWPRISAAAGEEIDAFLTARLRHHRETLGSVTDNPLLSVWLREAFDIFSRWSEGDESAKDFPVLDRIRAEFDAAGPAFAGLVSSELRASRDTRGLRHALEEMQGKLVEREMALMAGESRQRDLEGGLQEMHTRVETHILEKNQLVAGRATLELELATARRELEEAQNRLASLESTLIQRQEEIAQAWTEAGQQREAREALQQALNESAAREEAAEQKLVETNAWVFRVAGERRAFETQAARLERKLEQARAEHRVAEAALEKEKAAMTIRLGESECRIMELEDAVREKETRLGQALEEKRVAEKRLDDRFEEIAVLTQMLQDKRNMVAEAREALAQREAEMGGALEQARAAAAEACEALARTEAEMNAALDHARAAKELAEARLNERFGEIATLSSLLVEREALASHSTAKAEWLREASAILVSDISTRKGRLTALLPAYFRRRRQMKILERKGLFDGKAYLSAHPDVASEGIDPLHHYIRHGMAEGRRLG